MGVMYDDFNALNRLIDINKWGGFETENRGTEASRRIDAGKLRITARGAGILVSASPTGMIFSNFGLYHPNANSVTLWQATVEVVDFDAVACPVAGAAPSEAWAMIGGTFFNSGPRTVGSWANDVYADIRLVRRSNAAANTVAVEARAFRCNDASCVGRTNLTVTPFLTLGSPLTCPGRICPAVTLRILLEKNLNRLRFLRSGVPEQIVDYTLADGNQPGFATKILSVAPAPATCTAAAKRKTAFMDVLFDNVMADVVNVGTNVAFHADGLDAIDLGELPGPGEAPIP
jgi:hypothetical protein